FLAAVAERIGRVEAASAGDVRDKPSLENLLAAPPATSPEGERGAMAALLTQYRLFPPPPPPPRDPQDRPACPHYVGEEVFVNLRSDKPTGGARIVALSPEARANGSAEAAEAAAAADPRYRGRVKVRYHDNGSTCHVRPGRLTHVHRTEDAGGPAGATLMLVCASTADYRRLARSQCRPSDNILEVGCSYGECTALLAAHCKRCVGVDIGAEVVAAARERHGGRANVEFEQYDVFEWNGHLARKERFAGEDVHAVFVDIGGNRELSTIVRLIPFIRREIRPRLIVVKSAKLARRAERHFAERSAGPDSPSVTALHGEERRRASSFGVFPRQDEFLRELQASALSSETKAGRKLGGAGAGVVDGDDAAAAAPADGGRFKRHPLKYPPRRLEGSGRPVCRFFNYGDTATTAWETATGPSSARNLEPPLRARLGFRRALPQDRNIYAGQAKCLRPASCLQAFFLTSRVRLQVAISIYLPE
ncbi:MAG: hypothetical protein BJ554DRAFT_2775, partial [Olpidium bornovanus]